jgi:hypothetical protein
LVFNLNEVGMSECEDHKEKKMIIPATMDGQTMHHRASRSVRYISIITYIIAAEESLTLYIMISQDSHAILKRLTSRGVRLGVDFVLRHRSKPYVSGKLFLEYINIIFVPYLNKLQDSEELEELEELEACEAVFLMDNYSPHMSDDTVAVLTRVRVRIITFTLHMTNIYQVLDVVLFGALKKHAADLEILDEEQPAAAFLLKVYHDFKQTMIKVNIWGAIAAIEFTYDVKQNSYGRLFDEEKLRQSPSFVEPWESDTALESLSKFRLEAKFG